MTALQRHVDEAYTKPTRNIGARVSVRRALRGAALLAASDAMRLRKARARRRRAVPVGAKNTVHLVAVVCGSHCLASNDRVLVAVVDVQELRAKGEPRARAGERVCVYEQL